MSVKHLVTSERDRFRMVKPKWTLESAVMVWDVDVCADRELIAAASSDCSVYLAGLDGVLQQRLELPTDVRQVRFLGADQIVANGRAGALYGFRPQNHRSDCHWQLEWSCQLSSSRGGEQGVVTCFSVLPRGGVLAGFGSAETGAGGITIVNSAGAKTWEAQLGIAIMSVQATRTDDQRSIGVACGLDSRGVFSVHLVGDDAPTKPVLDQAALAKIAGASRRGDRILIGASLDRENHELQCIDATGSLLGSFPTEGFPVNAQYLDRQAMIAAACTPLNTSHPESQCNISVFTASGKVLWTRDMIKQAYQIAYDDGNQMLIVSSMGQGNVYSVNLCGEVMACARVRHAPLCFVADAATDMLLVGSGDLSWFSLSAFAQPGGC